MSPDQARSVADRLENVPDTRRYLIIALAQLGTTGGGGGGGGFGGGGGGGGPHQTGLSPLIYREAFHRAVLKRAVRSCTGCPPVVYEENEQPTQIDHTLWAPIAGGGGLCDGVGHFAVLQSPTRLHPGCVSCGAAYRARFASLARRGRCD